jgi:splicing factor 3B subunit 4
MSYTDFESADMAIESMNGQFLMNKPITIQNALKNDRKSKRHGTAAEQLLGTEAWKKMRCHLLHVQQRGGDE